MTKKQKKFSLDIWQLKNKNKYKKMYVGMRKEFFRSLREEGLIADAAVEYLYWEIELAAVNKVDALRAVVRNMDVKI